MSKNIFEIIIEDFKVRTIIGILEKERICEQEIIINAKISYVYEDNFLNYIEVINLIEQLIKTQKYALLEEAILDISERLKSAFPAICSLSLTLKKPEILDSCTIGVRGGFN